MRGYYCINNFAKNESLLKKFGSPKKESILPKRASQTIEVGS
jgi:hypothetical protein